MEFLSDCAAASINVKAQLLETSSNAVRRKKAHYTQLKTYTFRYRKKTLELWLKPQGFFM